MTSAKKSTERLLSAAAEFCRHDEVIRALRGQLRPCMDFSRGDASVGDYGTPMCDPDPKSPDRCEACEQRAKWKPTYIKALRGRQAAKRKMGSAFRTFSGLPSQGAVQHGPGAKA